MINDGSNDLGEPIISHEQRSVSTCKTQYNGFMYYYWWINIDPENRQFFVETSRPTPIWQGLC